jgi:hypothetical protein
MMRQWVCTLRSNQVVSSLCLVSSTMMDWFVLYTSPRYINLRYLWKAHLFVGLFCFLLLSVRFWSFQLDSVTYCSLCLGSLLGSRSTSTRRAHSLLKIMRFRIQMQMRFEYYIVYTNFEICTVYKYIRNLSRTNHRRSHSPTFVYSRRVLHLFSLRPYSRLPDSAVATP